MDTTNKNAEISLAETLAKYFLGSEEIAGDGWQMNFRFANGVCVAFGFKGKVLFFESVDPDESVGLEKRRKYLELTDLSQAAALFAEALNRATVVYNGKDETK